MRGAAAWLAVVVMASPVAAQQTPGTLQQPRGTWQTPGEIQKPRGTWQTPGAIQVPRGIEAIEVDRATCRRRFVVLGDALFPFDKSELTADATETLAALGPLLKAETGRIAVEGHTDSVGSRSYNQTLSDARARTVRDWLAQRSFIAKGTPAKGVGFDKPVAPNRNPDGSDNPSGRQKNRRVEVIVDSCRR